MSSGNSRRLWNTRKTGWFLGVGLTLFITGTWFLGRLITISPVSAMQIEDDGSITRTGRDWEPLAGPAVFYAFDRDGDGREDDRRPTDAVLEVGYQDPPGGGWLIHRPVDLWTLIGAELQR